MPVRVSASVSCGSVILDRPSGAVQVITNGALAANRIQMGTTQQSGSANFTCQRRHVAPAGGTVSNMVFTELHWYINTSSFTLTVLASTRNFKKWIEYPQGTFTPVLYSGSATATLSAAVKQISSDPLALNVPFGAIWWEHTMELGSVLGAWLELPATAAALGIDDAKYAAADANTPAHQNTGQASTFMFGSSLITGTITGAAGAKSVVVLGDSIPFGTGDVTGVGPLNSTGPWDATLDTMGVGHCKIAVGGMLANNMATIISSASPTFTPFFNQLMAAATHVIVEYGTNDLLTGQTQAQLIADMQTIGGACIGNGRNIAIATLTPRSTSTDAYATVANQTAKVDGNWVSRVPYNTVVRSLTGFGNFNRYVEYADVVESARDSGVWKASPLVGFQPTTDGTHPTSAMRAYVASNFGLTLP